MVKVILQDRKSAVLTSSSLACLSHIPTVNLTSGCAHQCLYCYTRGYSNYPGEGKVTVYKNTLEKLCEELRRKRKRPRAVYFSPSSDPFQPVPEVLDLTYEVFEFLFQAGLGVAFLTKGQIPDRHMKLLQANASQVRAQIGLITLDAKLAGIFEPYAAIPETRLAQAQTFVESGIVNQVRLDPILPGLTDSSAVLNDLCEKIATVGVKQIAISTLFLRRAVVAALKRNIQDEAILGKLLGSFGQASRMAIHAERSSVTALPASVRRTIHDRVREAAHANGLSVKICACKNPDIDTGSCSIAGDWSGSIPQATQRELFDNAERG